MLALNHGLSREFFITVLAPVHSHHVGFCFEFQVWMDKVHQSKTLNQENALSFICFPLKNIPWPRFPHNWVQPHLKLGPHLLKTFTNPIKTGLRFKFVIKSKPKSSAWLQMSLCSSNFHLFQLKRKKNLNTYNVCWWLPIALVNLE